MWIMNIDRIKKVYVRNELLIIGMLLVSIGIVWTLIDLQYKYIIGGFSIILVCLGIGLYLKYRKNVEN